MDPAFTFRETAPAASPLIFVGLHAIGAGHASNRKIAIGLERMPREIAADELLLDPSP
jgi:hypothetical protein